MGFPGADGKRALGAPFACMITRQGEALEETSASVRAAIAIGIDYVQVRRHDVSTGVLEHWLKRLCADAPEIRSHLIINARWDLALALGLAGVHLRQSSMPIESVRRFLDSRMSDAPPMLIGVSRHSVRGVVEAYRSGVDYVSLSPIFATISKPQTPPLGLAVFEEACRKVPIPVLALGGVRPEDIEEIGKSGAGGVTGIGLFSDERSIRRAADAIAEWKLRANLERGSSPQ